MTRKLTKKEFNIELDDKQFLFEMVTQKDGKSFLFCKPYFGKQTPFFMSVNDAGEWKIQYRDIVDKTIIAYEYILTEKLSEILSNENVHS